MLRIRLSMGGVRKRPIYKIVIVTVDIREMANLLKKLALTIHCFQKIKSKELK